MNQKDTPQQSHCRPIFASLASLASSTSSPFSAGFFGLLPPLWDPFSGLGLTLSNGTAKGPAKAENSRSNTWAYVSHHPVSYHTVGLSHCGSHPLLSILSLAGPYLVGVITLWLCLASAITLYAAAYLHTAVCVLHCGVRTAAARGTQYTVACRTSSGMQYKKWQAVNMCSGGT